jgi:hypothetical protein
MHSRKAKVHVKIKKKRISYKKGHEKQEREEEEVFFSFMSLI